jgi:oxygen-independent coproporphyrinogen-3 oxidase
MQKYTASLTKEIKLINRIYFKQGFKANALELGGGTPTFLPLNLIKDVVGCLLKELPFIDNHEFNFEASPETIIGQEGMEKLEYLKSAGANRMSIGIQSFVDKMLNNSNRPHNLEDVFCSIVMTCPH